MKKNIFKKAGRVFTSLALAVSICPVSYTHLTLPTT